MAIESLVKAQAREFDQGVGNKAEIVIVTTMNEALRVAQLEAPKMERARAGTSFSVGWTPTTTGRAPTSATPTTGATWLLWNGYDSSNPKSLYLDICTLMQLSGTAAVGGTVFWTLSKGAIAAPGPTAATGYTIKNNNNASSQTSKAIFADAQTLAADPLFWAPLASAGGGQMTAATTIGQSIQCDPQGSIVIPPGYAAGFCYVSGAGTTPLYVFFPTWTEFLAVNR